MASSLQRLSADNPALRQIRRVAWAVRALTLLAGIGLVSLPWALWLHPDWLAAATAGVPELKDVAFTSEVRLVTVAALLPLLSIALAALWQLWQLFGGYAKGEVFTEAAATHLRRLGLITLLMCVAKPLTGALLSVTLSAYRAHGPRVLMVRLSSEDYLVLLFGAVLLAIALVMREAVRLAKENAEFI
jgi:hypothetical protein